VLASRLAFSAVSTYRDYHFLKTSLSPVGGPQLGRRRNSGGWARGRQPFDF